MYNKYLIELYASELKQHNNAHLLAQKELKTGLHPKHVTGWPGSTITKET